VQILAGDMISKGPDSVGVIDLVMELGATGVRGNHEHRIIQEYTNMLASDIAITEDGEDFGNNLEEPTLEVQNWKDKKLVKALGKKRIRWLKNCPVILRVGELGHMGKVIVVHAGLEPGIELEKQDPNMVMNMRTIGKHGPSHEYDGRGWMKASRFQLNVSNRVIHLQEALGIWFTWNYLCHSFGSQMYSYTVNHGRY